MSEPCDLSATEARARIGRRALSPVELLESCIVRTQAINPAVNAMPAMDLPAARAAAARAEQAVMSGEPLGPLHGLPLGVKDLSPAKGLPFTQGSLLFRDRIATEDDLTVAACRHAGAIILGKTNTPEFGAGANTRNAVWGATGNPFDPVKSAAGSSGGSAAALACGMVALATGSDMGGSLRNPAAFCGVVGMRPSPGIVPGETRPHGGIPLSTNGPMARTVADAALMLRTINVPSPLDAFSRLLDTAPGPADLATLRVAITPDFGFAPVERGVVATFSDKTALVRGLFRQADDATPDCTGADRAFAVLRAIAFLSSHEQRYREHRDQVGPNVAVNVEEGLSYSALDVAEALTLQTTLQRRWAAFFDEYDLLIAPTIAITPRPWSELYPAHIDGRTLDSYYHWLALVYAGTLAGHPCLSLPVGLDAHGMPFGLQLIGRRNGDAALLAVAEALETALAADWRTARPVPDLARLEAAAPIASMPGFMGFG